MANNLWEALQLGASAGGSVAPKTSGFTGQLQTLIQAKSGKAIDTSNLPKTSNLVEQQTNLQAQALVNQQLAEANKDNQLVADKLYSVSESQKMQIAQLQQSQEEAHNQYRRQTDELYNNISKEFSQLNAQQQVSSLEQLGFQYSLSNSYYIENLQNEAARRRLDSKIQFDLATQAAVFSEYIDLLNSDLNFKKMIDIKNREAEIEIANMDFETAISIITSGMVAENRAATYSAMGQGIGDLAPAFAKGYVGANTSKNTNEETRKAQEQESIILRSL